MDIQGGSRDVWEKALAEYEGLIGWQYALFSADEKGEAVLRSAHFDEELSGRSIQRTRLTDGQTEGKERGWILETRLPAEKSREHAVYLSLFLNRIEAVGEERRSAKQRHEQTTAMVSGLSKEDFLKRVLTTAVGELEDLRKKLHLRHLQAARICLFACRDMSDQVKRLLGHLVPAVKEQLVTMDDHHVVLLSMEEDEAVFTADCRMMVEMIEAELMQQTTLTVSERYPFERLRIGYLEALTALRLGRLYYGDRRIIAFRDVAVARLLELLPAQEAKQFSQEILPESVWKQLHEDDVSTIYMMFANNLNISETARKLYIHRNTMVYRLDRIHKIIGLDIRIFEEAILLRMVLSLQKIV